MGGGGYSSPLLHNALFALFIGGILAYGAGFAWYMLAKFDLINLIRDVNNDDAFYYFQIAYNLAVGKFSTFDGGITQTNGYHPLWLLLITPFYWVFDKEAALFGIKAFEIMLIAGGVALIAVAARLARLPWILLFALLPLLYQHSSLFRGMEAAAALFILALFFLVILLYAWDPARWKWPLAAVAFALPWVRLEYIAISLAATTALCLIEWSRQERPASASWREFARSMLALNAVAPLLGAVAGILVYFAYNGLVVGGIVPVSGATKQIWSQIRFEREGGYSLAQNFRDVLQIPVFDYELLVALEVCAYLLLVWWFAHRSRNREDWLLLAFLVGVFGLAAEHLAKFAQTVLTVHPYWGSYNWYFVPAYLMMALIVPVRCYVAIHLVRHFVGPRWPHAANILSVGIVVVGAAFLLTIADFIAPFRYVDRASESTSREREVTSYMGVQVMDLTLPDNSVIGSWDAGVIGYFSRFPVVNLDGLVNSYDYMRAQQEGTESAFYQRYGITHFANLQLASKNLDAMLFEGLPYGHHESTRQFRLWPAEPTESVADHSAWFWERMEPHLTTDRSAKLGLTVDGRLAQAFAEDCAPDELAIWYWAGQEDGTPVESWTQTRTGLCVDAVVMPHNAAHPVRVEIMAASDYIASLVGDHQPAIRSDFDVYLVENRLIYVKQQCEPDDVDAMFFLHLYPVDVNDLPGHRKQYGFDNLDFHFDGDGGRFGLSATQAGGICLADVPLPEYGITSIRTGQYVRVDGKFERPWEGEIRLVE